MLQTIYRNGNVRVVGIVTLLAVEVEGRGRVEVFPVGQVEDAVTIADEIAARGSEQGLMVID